MGCGASKRAQTVPMPMDAVVPGEAMAKPPLEKEPTSSKLRSSQTSDARQEMLAQDGGGYSAFVSHFKAEAAMEARFLQRELEPLLDGAVFLDRWV